MEQAIDATLETAPNFNQLGTLSTDDTAVEAICFHKTIYFPAPFIGFFLEYDLTPVEACSCLCGAIFDSWASVDCHPIIYWLHFLITNKSVVYLLYPLAMYCTTTPLVYRNLIRHYHQVLTRHLSGIDLALQRV